MYALEWYEKLGVGTLRHDSLHRGTHNEVRVDSAAPEKRHAIHNGSCNTRKSNIDQVQVRCTTSKWSFIPDSVNVSLHMGHWTMTSLPVLGPLSSEWVRGRFGSVAEPLPSTNATSSATNFDALRFALGGFDVATSALRLRGRPGVLASGPELAVALDLTQPSSLFFWRPARSFADMASSCFFDISGS
jgi:hypothetical protein